MPTTTVVESAEVEAAVVAPTSTPTRRRTVNFARNTRAFKRTYRMARRTWKTDHENPLVSFHAEGGSILGEETSPVGHMFGIEMEFNNGDQDSFTTDCSECEYDGCEECGCDHETCGGHGAIADFLFGLGLLDSPIQSCYHSGSYDANKWRFEEDATVSGGEVITKVLHDNTDSWQMLTQVIEGLNTHNADATETNAGGHIHIDSTGLGNNAENWARLDKLAAKFEDVMFRLATNPHRARRASATRGSNVLSLHRRRSNSYCEPIARRAEGDSSSRYYNGTYGALGNVGHLSRSTWLNVTGNVNSNTGMGHVEFRIFDGCLDAAMIQTHVKIAVAMMRAACNPAIDEALNAMPDRPLGWHRKQDWWKNEDGTRKGSLRGEGWINDSLAIRQFVDMMFDNTTDREQIITLFAMNDWSYSRRRGQRSRRY